MTPEEQFLEFIERSDKGEKIDPGQVEQTFNELKPVEPDQLVGYEWKGGTIKTGTVYEGFINILLKTVVDWAGKRFYSMDDVEPIMIYTKTGERKPYRGVGAAKLKRVLYQDIETTAMVYNSVPITDFFHYVNNDTVIGLMKTKPKTGDYFFYLIRLQPIEERNTSSL
ncbi:hypothetical protein BDA99DRAFT_596378 [Phascolomyces articulosus]|uniref:GXWXG protein n=1 Tax=Phascolomyces articulosus TaxID=60185 RepID=A0AAD5KM64_9FUNG|nr:hypothetical protein BDA99DRAFT_596378 [Phascolomyces articulosus]